MSVNKLWTLIYDNQEDRVSTFGFSLLVIGILMSTEFSQSYIRISRGK